VQGQTATNNERRKNLATVEVDKIEVGERRRSSGSGINGLAESIKEEGLLHPIGVTEDLRLIYGGRRLAAYKLLNRKIIAAIIYGRLEELELRQKELAENVERVDLTAEERDRAMIKLAEITRELVREEEKTRSNFDQVSPGSRGPAQEPGGDRSVTRRMGVARTTLKDAKDHIAGIEKYPDIAKVYERKGDRRRVYRTLENMSEKEREFALAAMAAGFKINKEDLLRYQRQEEAKLGKVALAVEPAENPETESRALKSWRNGHDDGEEVEEPEIVRIKRVHTHKLTVELDDGSTKAMTPNQLKGHGFTKCAHCGGHGVHETKRRQKNKGAK
jgi:ParB-like chromosome segregation protein Spo0J